MKSLKKADFILIFYINIFFICIFLLNFIFVNEEFYVSLGLFSFIMLIFIFVRNVVVSSDFFFVKDEFEFFQKFLIKYYDFLKQNFFFFSAEIYIWVLLYKIYNLKFNIRYNLLGFQPGKNLSGLQASMYSNLNVYYKLYYNYLFDNVVQNYLFFVVYVNFDFLKANYLSCFKSSLDVGGVDKDVFELFLVSTGIK